MNTNTLYIVSTPIGNLADITFRALETFKRVDSIICEDTRTTKKLLNHYEISTPTISLYSHLKRKKSFKPMIRAEKIVHLLQEGKSLALVTDAGTPGISDPGNQIVKEALAKGLSVIPIPGVSALTALVSVSGIDLAHFVFLGFPPHKKGRETFFKEIIVLKYPVIYFESPHRLIKNLKLLQKLNLEKNIILGRELTKMFEEIVRGDVKEILTYFENNKEKIRGEIAIIVY